MAESVSMNSVESGNLSPIQRLLRLRKLLQVRPFDTSTPEGRSAERYRRVAWSTLLSAVARVIALGISFVSVPLVVGYLKDPVYGNERYGMWLTMSSLVATLGPLDLGIGLGLLTVLSDAYGRDDKETARRAISTAMAMLTAISTLAALCFAALYFVVPWARVFNVSSPTAISEAGPAVAVLFGAFVVGLPLATVGQVQLAHQSGYVSSAWAIVGNLGSFAALLLVIHLHGSLPVLILALAWVGLVTAALNGYVLYRHQRPWLMPSLRKVDLHLLKPLFRTGLLFLVLQLAGLAAFQLDNIVITQILGPSYVPEYALPGRLFYLAPTLLSFVLTPLWPAYRESLARGDTAWVKRTLRRSILLAGMINIPNAVFMVVAGPFLLHIWVGNAVHPTLILMVGLGTWAAMNTLNGPIAMLLNGANRVAFQAGTAIFMATANVLISIWLVQRIGVSGAVFGNVISQGLFGLVPQVWYTRRLLRQLAPSPKSTATAT